MKYTFILIILLMFTGCRDHDMDEESMLSLPTVKPILYYGDINDDSVVAIDIETMLLTNVIASSGIYPYEVAQGFANELFVMNRHDYNIGVLNSDTDTIEHQIDLDFMPRSLALRNDDILISSANEPSSAVVTADQLSDKYSDSAYVSPTSFGGSNATGHPLWINDNYFLLLDRTENSIELYEKGSHRPSSKLQTKSSVHHVMYRDGYFYGIAEGEQNGVSPGVVKFTVSNGDINLTTERLISTFDSLPTDFESSSWGSHHGALHPDADYLYIGSAEGNVFVLDLESLNLVDTFKTGKGIGHILFYHDMLITTNHYDNYKSFYNAADPENNLFLKELHFSSEIYPNITMQSHTSHIVDDHLYFAFNTDQESVIYNIDLINITIAASLHMNGRYCLMGSSVETLTSGM